MKRLALLIVVTLICGLVVVNCKKAPKGPEGATPEGQAGTAEQKAAAPAGTGVAPESISKSLSDALCKRMIECAPGTMEEADCATQTNQSLNDALKQNPLTVTQVQLDTCVASIGKGTCEEVMGTEPPAGCEFLK